MSNPTITKGSVVEVTTDEPEFHGSWYVATFIDEVEPSPTTKMAPNKKNKNLTQTQYLVNYHTLFSDPNCLQPVTEVVDSSFVRPLPPRSIRRNNGGSAKEAEVVEGEDGGEFEVDDVVDAYHWDGWWVGVVKKVVGDGEMRKYVVVFENCCREFEFERCMLRFHVDWIGCRWLVPPKKAYFARDCDCVFKIPDKELAKRSWDALLTYSRKRFKIAAGSKGNTKVVASVLDHQDSPHVEHSIITTQTREAEDAKRHQKRKRGRPPKSVVNKPISLLQGSNRNRKVVASVLDHQDLPHVEHGTITAQAREAEDAKRHQKRKRGRPPKSVVNVPISLLQGVNPDVVNIGAGTTQQDWPFVKRSPIWATIESLKLYVTPSQKPHFSSLKNMKQDTREGLAIGHMVTYGNLVKRLYELQLSDSVDMFNANLETLCELETHGFDVGPIRGRLNNLLSLKSKVGRHDDTRKEVEKELRKCSHEMRLVDKEMDELKAKMAQTLRMQNAKDEEIVRLQSKLDLVSNQINDWELAFKELVSAPL